MKPFFAIFLLSTLSSAISFGGSFGGNPADEPSPEEGSAWFLGERTVHWCVDTDVPYLSSAFEKSLAIWRKYLATKSPVPAPGEPALSFRFEPLSACDGREDLKIVVEAKSTDITTRRLSYDANAGWSRGEIHLGDGSLARENLTAQLIRALGSILGCGSVTGTILEQGAALDSLAIDRRKELLSAKTLNFVLTRTGRTGSGHPQAQRASLALHTFPENIRGELNLAAVGVYQLTFHPAYHSLRISDQKLFKKFYQGQLYFQLSEGREYSGTVTTPDGKTFPALLKLNLQKALELLYFREGRLFPLFTADSYAD